MARFANTASLNLFVMLTAQGPFKVEVQNVEKPQISNPNDIIVRVTTAAICGSDLHMYEGRTAAESGIVFGHENSEYLYNKLEIIARS